jgi:hypothetical protein
MTQPQATINISAQALETPYNPMVYWDSLYRVRSAIRELLRYLVTLGVFLGWAEVTRRHHPELGYSLHIAIGALFTIWLSAESGWEVKRRVRDREIHERSQAATRFSEAMTDTVYWTISLTPRWVDGQLALRDAQYDEGAQGNTMRELTALYMADSKRVTELVNAWRTARFDAWMAFQRLRACPTVTEANQDEHVEEVTQLKVATDALVETCNRCSDEVWDMVRTPKRRWFHRR